MTMPHVIVVDDDLAVRTSLCRLFSTRPGTSISHYASGDDFLGARHGLVGGVLLLDIHMPGSSGLDVLRVLRSEPFRFAAIGLTGQGDLAMAVQALKLGAIDFVEKPCDHIRLFDAVDRASIGLERKGQETGTKTLLTDREMEVLLLLAEGRSNAQIAQQLEQPLATIEAERASILATLKAQNLIDALRVAFVKGILSRD